MKFGILGNFNKDNFYNIFNDLGHFLKNNNIDFYLAENKKLRLSKILFKENVCDFNFVLKESDIILSIGGDGTIISSIRKCLEYKKPILGIHIGGLGFLAECNKDNYKDKILSIEKGDYYIENRMLLNVEIPDKKINYNIINELVIDRRESARTIKTNISISNKFINTYESDGIIFSTPTGSTAYSLSAGGPIVYPDMKIIIITPICPHTLSMRPVIIPSDEVLEVTFENSRSKELSLTIDGQIQKVISSKIRVLVEKSNCSAYLVKFKESDYFKTLRNKMAWKGNMRSK